MKKVITRTTSIAPKIFTLIVTAGLAGFLPGLVHAENNLSEETTICLNCHKKATPGIVADWRQSLHSQMTMSKALAKSDLEKRVSADQQYRGATDTVIGCAECHMLNTGEHDDHFEHNGFTINVIVSPRDCASCHPVEVKEYQQNIMSKAYRNLNKNPVFRSLVHSVNANQSYDGSRIHYAEKVEPETEEDSCNHCHGTKVQVKGMQSRMTDMGKMSFPVLEGWPNQGVGRINPDGSEGSCTSCHPRHSFSIEIARKPAICSECHKGPDVPAYKVYSVSKHGNIYDSLKEKWNFEAVPWTVGRDFSAPTCAVCHMSLLQDKNGKVITRRSHQMNDRLPWRIFGLIYAHAHPKSPDTTIIKNKAGLPLPTELTGEEAEKFLIDEEEQEKRWNEMSKVCLSCHSQGWVEGYYDRFLTALETTNDMTLTATKIMLKAWEKGAASGLAQNDSIFNEAMEKMWVQNWLFFANSTRFASAMAGADYGVFANGRWYQSLNVQKLADYLDFKLGLGGKAEE